MQQLFRILDSRFLSRISNFKELLTLAGAAVLVATGLILAAISLVRWKRIATAFPGHRNLPRSDRQHDDEAEANEQQRHRADVRRCARWPRGRSVNPPSPRGSCSATSGGSDKAPIRRARTFAAAPRRRLAVVDM